MSRPLVARTLSNIIGPLFVFMLLITTWDAGWRLWAANRPLPLSVTLVQVDDAKVGECPAMHVEREIYRNFEASWRVEIERGYETESGLLFVVSQVGMGSNSYAIDNIYPEPLTLDWWLNSSRCDLTVGTYRIETTWRIDLGAGQYSSVRVLSNNFTITE